MTSPIPLHAAPSAGFDEPFEMLAACHERVERMLTLLGRLHAHLLGHANDEQARQAARDVMRYFDQAGPHHHEDEERHLFPALLAESKPELTAVVARLQSDHQAMVRQWALLRADLQRVAEGRNPVAGDEGDAGADPAALARRWAEFAALYRQHIVLEDGQAYPAAAALLGDDARRAMGQEMAQRRGVPPPP